MYIGPKSRTERPRTTKFGTKVAHVTRDSDTTFKVKGQGHVRGQGIWHIVAASRLQLVDIWNNFPIETVNVSSTVVFKKKLDQIDFTPYFFVCLFAWGLMALSAQIGYIAP